MDINEYAMEHLMREHLSALRAAARQHTLARLRPARPGLRVRLGSALVHAGEWLRAGAKDPAPSHCAHG